MVLDYLGGPNAITRIFKGRREHYITKKDGNVGRALSIVSSFGDGGKGLQLTYRSREQKGSMFSRRNSALPDFDLGFLTREQQDSKSALFKLNFVLIFYSSKGKLI